MFRIEMLPAAHGDALLVEYGDSGDIRRILIDGGTPGSYRTVAARLRQMQEAEGPLVFELLVISHIDDDHIGGILSLLEKKEISITFRDIWFNGYGHLLEDDIETMGPVQGERLTQLLLDQKLPWNVMHKGRSLRVSDDPALPSFTLPGDMTLTLLSPDSTKLSLLREKWEEVCAEVGLDPNAATAPLDDTEDGIESFGPIDMDELITHKFKEDTAEANGSSIAFLAEHEGKRVLFAADAHPGRLLQSINHLVGTDGKLTLDACKLSHHGSDHNTCPDLLRRLDCTRYLVSTSGSRFKHPHRTAIARLIRTGTPGKEIIFNYRSDYSGVWDDEHLKSNENYTTRYPEPDSGQGVVVDI